MSRPVDNIVRLFGNEPLRLHEIDIENLVGTGKPTREQVQAIRKRYRSLVPELDRDLVVLAAGPQNRYAVIEGWPGAIYIFKKGADGADEALVDFYNQIEDKSIFTDLFIASGDNKFASVCTAASRDGIRTTVVLGAGKKSWKLRASNSISLLSGAHNG
jgi:hypothetical protein